MGPDLFQTAMGRHFFEGTMPALVRELKRLNDSLEAKAAPAEPLPPLPDGVRFEAGDDDAFVHLSHEYYGANDLRAIAAHMVASADRQEGKKK